MIYHIKPVVAGAPHTFVVGDMPFGAYNSDLCRAVDNATQVFAEGGCDCLKMKEVLYDRPYPNEERRTPYEGFSYEAIVPVDETITLRSREDIQNLFRMTPYAWKTPREGKDRLAARDTLTTRISFRVHIFRRDEDR